MDFLVEAFSFDFKQAVLVFLRIAFAFLLAVPIGWRHVVSYASQNNPWCGR